jgi:hypothetical protein
MLGTSERSTTMLDQVPARGRCSEDGPVAINRGTRRGAIARAVIPGKFRSLGALAPEDVSIPASRRAMAYRLVLGVVLPQLLYYVGVRLKLAVPAIGAVVAWTAVLAVYDLRRSTVDPFVLYGVAVTVGQAAVALLIRNPLVFAARSVVENLLDGLGFLASVAVGRPFAALALNALRRLSGRALLPAATDRALRRLTLLWACLFFLRAASLYAGLIHLPLGWFLIVSTVAGWPINAVGAAASLAYLRGTHGPTPRGRPL